MSAVEAKGEFVEVVVEMLMLDATVERSHEPSLEQRGDLVNPRHQFMGCFGSAADRTDVVSVTQRGQTGVAPPTVSMDRRTARHCAQDERQQAVGRDVLDAAQPYPADGLAVPFSCHCDDRLGLRFATPLAFFR